MPTETAIIVAGIVLMFAVFAVTLAWADYYTRDFAHQVRRIIHDLMRRNSISPALACSLFRQFGK